MNCLFCKIISGEIPAKIIFEDDIVMAFLDVFPDTPGHTLIVPKKHYECLDDIPEDVLNHIMNVSKILKKKIEQKLDCDGFTLIQNNGVVQQIKHFHLHLKPFYTNKKDKTLEEVYELLK